MATQQQEKDGEDAELNKPPDSVEQQIAIELARLLSSKRGNTDDFTNSVKQHLNTRTGFTEGEIKELVEETPGGSVETSNVKN